MASDDSSTRMFFSARALLCLVVLLSWLSCNAGDEHDGHKNEGGHEDGHEDGHEERVWQALYLAAGILALIIVPQVGSASSPWGATNRANE